MCTSKWLFVILFVACVARSDSHTRAWQAETRTPSELMVDVINNLGLNILKLHNENNENNIALSPYGLASILTALLEGVRGRAALEIQQCGGFPTDPEVIRVGLRDIHRLLRSYFIPQEGFLSGLSLSSEKVTLKSEYQAILRFYGFDMTSFNTPIYPDVGTTTPMNNVTSNSTDTTTDNAVTTETTTDITNTTTIKPTTQIDEITTVTSDTTTLETTMPATTLPTTTTMNDVTTDTTFPTTTPFPETTTSNSATTTMPETTTFSTITTTVKEITTTLNVATTTADLQTTTVSLPPTTTNPPTTLNETTESTTEPTETPGATTTEITATGNTETTTVPTETTTVPTETTTVPAVITTVPAETSSLRIRRVGRSVVDYFLARYYDDRIQDTYTPARPDNKYSFLVGGKFQETHVHFMTYDVVLPFTYIHSLNALALRFPLDSPKYYLLLILPIDDQGIDRLLCDLGKTASLKQIVSYMRPTYVRAVIPSFMLRGFVILTSSLQKIGIREIFEPRRSDFSIMTDDQDIYVTNIEQAITVMIKNYMDPNMLRKNGNLYQYGPVEFKATHPFLYFVMDSEIDVALVAGKIVNPINSRIQ